MTPGSADGDERERERPERSTESALLRLPAYATCSFCQDLAGERECALVAQNEHAAAEVDERQYERGAMLVIPREHRETILDLSDREIAAIYQLARDVGRAAVIAFGATGMNVYQNNGPSAGQREPHLHVHVVPRYANSQPDKRFLQDDHRPVSIDDQRLIAAAIRAAM